MHIAIVYCCDSPSPHPVFWPPQVPTFSVPSDTVRPAQYLISLEVAYIYCATCGKVKTATSDWMLVEELARRVLKNRTTHATFPLAFGTCDLDEQRTILQRVLEHIDLDFTKIQIVMRKSAAIISVIYCAFALSIQRFVCAEYLWSQHR